MKSPDSISKTQMTSSGGKQGIGITLRIALLSWTVAMATLVIFIAVMAPKQRITFLDQLESKANSVALSLQDATAGAAINEDYASVITSAQTMIEGDPSLDFLIVMKNDGFSLVIEQDGWRVDDNADAYWLDRDRKTTGQITTVPLFDRRVFHFAKPFNYSGIEWGWIHVGLSLSDYDQSIASLTRNTLLMAVGCIVFSFVISWLYSKQVVRPVLRLRSVVQQIADGDLSVRVDRIRKDELGSLAGSVNTMADALLRRDRILESIRVAAQQFMHAPHWEDAIDSMLSGIGTAAGASRAVAIEIHKVAEGQLQPSKKFVWQVDGLKSLPPDPDMRNIPYARTAFKQWLEVLSTNEIVSGPASEMSFEGRTFLESIGVRSIIIIPVFVEKTLWGHVGLDDCIRERIWTEAETDSLRAGADMLGATISRQRAQEALVEAKETLEQRVKERTRELETQVAAKETALAELAEAQSSLLEVSRAAGMAEVATGVLHNVGNVLNSVNVSCTLVSDQLRESRVGNLARVADLLAENRRNLSQFLSEDPRGQKIPKYLTSLASALEEEHKVMQRETGSLQDRIEHIKEIVAMQQSYGRVSGISETISAEKLMEDALKLNTGALSRHQVRVRRQYEAVSPITVDKHAVLQILLNLINNAKYACTDSDKEEKIITLRVLNHNPGRIQMQVEDNGIGISRDNLTRIFQHGFTTKKTGHGFGLHSGALTARTLGGSLTVSSDGPGFGATFTLELPCTPGGKV
jgi:signal transduction histidine kinase